MDIRCELKIVLLLVIVGLSSLLTLVQARHTKRVGYGGTCNSTAKCQVHSLLTCEDNTCICLYQDAMTYSTELGTCLSLVNEVCGYLETKHVVINCIANAVCDQQQGVCKCNQNFVEVERMCIPQKSYGETCHSNSECKPDLSLTCFEEVCQCDPEKHVPILINFNGDPTVSKSKSSHKKSEMKCVTRAGSACTTKTGCVPKATCAADAGDDEAVDSQLYNWNHSGVCKCDENYETDKDGFCRGKYGSNCDVLANITCLDNLRCLNGMCDCKYPDDQVYLQNNSQCVSLLGGPCSTESDSNDDDDESNSSQNKTRIQCDRFLACKDGICECDKGFVENSERSCDLSYGQPCTGQTMNKCDRAAGLYCVEGKCSCKDDRRTYDSSTGKCLGKKGASCNIVIKEEKEVPSPIENSMSRKSHRGKHKGRMTSSECVKGAACQVSREQLRGLTTRGTCKSVKHKESASYNENGD